MNNKKLSVLIAGVLVMASINIVLASMLIISNTEDVSPVGMVVHQTTDLQIEVLKYLPSPLWAGNQYNFEVNITHWNSMSDIDFVFRVELVSTYDTFAITYGDVAAPTMFAEKYAIDGTATGYSLISNAEGLEFFGTYMGMYDESDTLTLAGADLAGDPTEQYNIKFSFDIDPGASVGPWTVRVMCIAP
ncbi:MAG: hypothetical protein ACW98I_20240 [Candidatus Hodarchaeales archaeon]